MTAEARPFSVLLVEDDEDDIRITKRAFKRFEERLELIVAHNGRQCLEHLERAHAGQAQRPDLILMDLNMPVLNGQDTLRAIKADERFSSIPVVVLTTSGTDEDVASAYSSHASCYIVKPVDFDRFDRIVRTMEEFWFGVVRLPEVVLR